MQQSKNIIIFIVLGITTVLCEIFDYKMIYSFSKALIVPTIFVYYIRNCKKVDFFFITMLISFFLGEIFIIKKYSVELIMAPFFFNYILLSIQGIINLKFDNLKVKDILPILFIIGMITFLFYEIIEMISSTNTTLFSYLLTYNSVVILSILTSVCNMYNKMNLKNTLLALAIMSYVFSDIFYALNNYYFKLTFLVVISYPLQMLCYFLLVKYFLIIERKKLNNDRSSF
jgi:hypothetical protein